MKKLETIETLRERTSYFKDHRTEKKTAQKPNNQNPSPNSKPFDENYYITKTHVGVNVLRDPTMPNHRTKLMSNVPTSDFQHPTSSTAITLVALVITIIVLLILAGVTLRMVLGENGIFEKANEAKEKTNIANIKEQIQMDIANKQAEKKGDITITEIEEILEKYGTINYEEDGKQIKGITTYENKYEILLESIANKATDEKVYLYKKGNEFINLTGGWKQGSNNIGSLKKQSNCMNMQASIPDEDEKYWNCCQTVNSIDVSEFRKIVFKVEIDNVRYLQEQYWSWSQIALCNPEFESYDSRNDIIASHYSTQNDISKQITIIELDIQNINENVYPSFLFCRWSTESYESNINIYEVWLEK